jgi:hypothetical protein
MILFSALRPAVAAPGTPGDDQLRAIIAGLDARMFDAYNAHDFCHTEKGQPDCGTFRFVQVWRLKDGRWQVVRELSYGH